MDKKNFLIYGSYGYSGNLIAEQAKRAGLTPVLAGRNREKLAAQAKELGLTYCCFDLNDIEQTINALQPFIAVLHCAGPFIHTYKNMVTACLATNTHYLDITGEYEVIEKLSQLNTEAIEKNITILPGAGFDVVPSDCLAFYLKTKLPDANRLTLAIYSKQKSSGLSISRGTARTMAENLAVGAMIRDEGLLKPAPMKDEQCAFNFNTEKPIHCVRISWGDLASAWWSTRIPHIETYMSLPLKMIKFNQFIKPIKSIFKWRFTQKIINKLIDKMPEGPSEIDMTNSIVKIYGEVSNQDGKKISAVLETPNGYQFTALSAVFLIKKVLTGSAATGFQTPATVTSENIALQIPGVRLDDESV